MDFDLYTIAQILCEKTFKPLVPYDTGNMATLATKVEKVAENRVRIYVDSAIAPYVVYTNEPWLSQKWKGKKNPNEKWFERAVEMVAQELAAMLGGTLSTEEV